ncbi:F-box domain-containing protein [Heracleum sosnowskyi]|uniref:F-box domain-containing protein n=1 Tax=Heracleum sosnowskyi TaxID=360622 RepID=A0AAD8HJ62_9APIA|nr:F-box domain-containing protein [Heracleum sosnowskyi]
MERWMSTITRNAPGDRCERLAELSIVFGTEDLKAITSCWAIVSVGGGGDDAVAVPVDGPLKTLLSGAEFFGAANGLVCLAKNQMNELLILNPSTRKAREIPTAPADFPRSFDCSEIGLCGFGYDHVNDDYKIVKIAECNVKFHGIMVIVYSLKINSWKRIQNVPASDTQFLGDRGLFANGALHWFTIKAVMDFSNIVSFDLGLEQFKEIPFPPNGTFGRSLVPVEESLGVLYKYSSRVDVWLMNNSGVGNLWTKALSLKQAGPLGSFSFARPVAFSKSRKNVLLEVDSSKLVWYDLKRKRIKNVRIRGIPINFESYLYTESLLQVTEDKKDKPLQKPSHGMRRTWGKQSRRSFGSEGVDILMFLALFIPPCFCLLSLVVDLWLSLLLKLETNKLLQFENREATDARCYCLLITSAGLFD